MTTEGFYITKLRLEGNEELFSEIELKKGLNVIVGPTNTGKSYIFDCINYMLGGKDAPEQIDEVIDNGYHTIFMEIESNRGQRFTFRRGLSGGNFIKYNCPLNQLTQDTSYETLSQKHSGKKDSMSRFLMSLSGFEETNLYIKTNLANKLNRFTYRNFNDFVLINEMKIISKESPVHSDNNKTKTAEESAFRLILTNKDDSQLTENFKENSSNTSVTVQIELIDSLINTLDLNTTRVLLASNEDIEALINNLTVKRSGISSDIESLSKSRKVLWTEIQQCESKMLSTNELLKRFRLLNDQYKTDIDRISFLIEGEHYFSLLNYEKCPTCDQTIKNGILTCSHIEKDQKQESYRIELQKISLHREDLLNTITVMEEEFDLLVSELENKKNEYNRLSKIIDEQLEPQSFIVQEELRKVLETQKYINETEEKKNTLNKLLNEKRKLLGLIGSESEAEIDNTPVVNDYSSYYEKLCESIQYYLKGWKYPGYEDIKFDNRQKDIIISGKSRRLFGKGYRSISYSAFVLGLMRYCNQNGLPHPGLVVLDSPITSYKEEDGDEDKTSEDLQARFFEYLSQFPYNNQVIILENKIPPKNVIQNINYIEFTKNHDRGRYGFIVF
ncbi:AAA family ATPase [Paenibacillus pedocola]|uniref:AAA family ATPase n=1 Tax=Paenibacillus pedocola TaxID=3242193 RepID=UPI002877DD97|nr:hypothetical protein [Paenibacillus typhae]